MQVEDRLRDQVREMYRSNWNVPARRRVLAHVPSLMIWGPQEVFHPDNKGAAVGSGGEGSRSSSSQNVGAGPATNTGNTSEVINRVCREVYWEYQRQLWTPEFAGKGGTDEFHFHRWGQVRH